MGGLAIGCTIGRSGARRRKREGDGATPFGRFSLIAWYAPLGPPRLLRRHGVPRAITRATGWCDDVRHPAYNQPLRLPARAAHESMARGDGKYDVVGVMDYNIRPRVRGAGSAIFFHINESGQGTEGCVALAREDMRRLLPRLGRQVTITVQ